MFMDVLSFDPEFNRLLLILLGILVSASVTSALIRWRVAHNQPHAVIDNLIARINAWWVMAAVLSICVLAGELVSLLLFALISLVSLREYCAILYKHSNESRSTYVLFYAALAIQFYLIYIHWYGMFVIFIPVYAFIAVAVLEALRGESQGFLERVAKFQCGLMICVFFISHVVALFMLHLNGFEKNAHLLAFLLLVVQCSDVLQYIWGKLFGRHKVAPALSPSKTWEGLVGGILSATLLGASCYWLTPFTPWQAAAVSFILCVTGFFGGLVMSAIKRDNQIKDWGNLIDGHGGMLDRLDSIVFSAPVFFHLLRYFWS
jgi:phosphatidate cytidylyltransferase